MNTKITDGLLAVAFRREGELTIALNNLRHAVEDVYPEGSQVQVRRGRGSWVGTVLCHTSGRYSGELRVRHNRTKKVHGVYFRDVSVAC